VVINFEKVYDQHLEEALRQLGLDAHGVALSEGWEVDAPLLRSLLRRLRGICTHPQVRNSTPGFVLTSSERLLI
jgi:hypothetical protein